MIRGLLRPTPMLQEPRQTGQTLLLEGARSTRGGLRVGVVDSLGGSFVGALEPWIAYAAAVPKREVLCCRSADGLPDPAGFLRQTVRGKIPNRAF
jgi:hypothetical protein